jgi:hypothetical protein
LIRRSGITFNLGEPREPLPLAIEARGILLSRRVRGGGEMVDKMRVREVEGLLRQAVEGLIPVAGGMKGIWPSAK